MATSVAVSVRDEQAYVAGERCNGGYLRIYGGEQPSGPESKAGAPLAELRFGSPAFGKPVKGKITANKITKDDNARGSGDATWYRVLSADGDAVWDGDVSKKGKGGSLELDALTIRSGAEVSVGSLTYTQP